ncbi:MAG: hypothetical protein Fues2KO_26060 [Fuerstiella sp.]
MRFLFGKITPHGVRPGMFGGFGPFFSGLLSLLWAPFRFLGFVAVIGGRVAAGWFGKRQFRYLLYGVPSIVAFAVFGVFLVRGVMYGGSHRADQYANAAAKAAKAGQWKEAQLFYQRAIDMGRNERSTRFELAKSAQQNGDLPVKVAIMDSLAPLQVPSFAPAHLWQAVRILNQGTLDRSDVDAATTHLKHVLSLEPNHSIAHGTLGSLYFELGAYELAKSHLKQTRGEQPVWKLMLAKACALTGDKGDAAAYAEQAQRLFRRQVQRDPTDIQARLDYGEATLLLEQFPQAIAILQEGQKLEDSDRYRKAMAQVAIHWSDAILRDNPKQRTAAFDLLAKALAFDPNDMQLFGRITELLKQDDETSEQIKDFLQDNIARGAAVPLSHLILGTVALSQENGRKDAEFHMTQAFELMPNGPIVANNYAWFLKDIEPVRSLQIMDDLVRRYPESVEFRDTRGHVYCANQQWERAITDLERSLSKFPDREMTHRRLADSYAALGKPELAEKHRELADSLVVQ